MRDAFAALGHDSWSCDLLPTLQPGNHLQCDVREVLADGWDMMIAHPPCTYLNYAGMRHWLKPGRAELREAALAFFMEIVNAPIPRICVENPRGYPNQAYRKPDQVIHPYFFGDPVLKRRCLWLKHLPPLWRWPEDELFGRQTAVERPAPLVVEASGKARYFTEYAHGRLVRSQTFAAVAAAMAAQWGGAAL